MHLVGCIHTLSAIVGGGAELQCGYVQWVLYTVTKGT